jgi:hypothetical protein
MGIKYKVNEDFFKTWSRVMAYVLGYWYADGSLENAVSLRGKYIRVTSIDEGTILKIKRWLGSEHTIVVLEPTEAHPGKTRYFLRIGSHVLYNDLEKLGLYPNKSLTVQFPQIPEKYLKDFVRGYLDGDGCVYLETKKGIIQEKIVKRLVTIFTSGSFDFLVVLCETLRNKLNVNQINIYSGARAFQLRYSTGDSMKIFEFLYSGCYPDIFLRRKFDVFKAYYELRPIRVNKGVASILQKLAT